MERPKLDWKTFSSRRRLDVPAWLKNMQIESYEDLKKWCESKDMVPPEKKEVSEHFKAPKPKKAEPIKPDVVHKPVEEKVTEKEEIKPTTPVKTTRKNRTKKVVDLED